MDGNTVIEDVGSLIHQMLSLGSGSAQEIAQEIAQETEVKAAYTEKN